jgi:Tol biopolymer transport system component/DNA-binding winged helix-turn-helix (wHTH) protein
MSFTASCFYKFADFAVDLDQRVLLRGDNPVPLTPKVFDTLLVLLEQHGRLVTKDQLMSRLWPDSFVEESNLTFNIQQLRRALGDNARKPVYIETLARRGYRFKAAVEEVLSDGRAVEAHVSIQLQSHEWKAGNGSASKEDQLGPEFAFATMPPLNGARVGREIAPSLTRHRALRSPLIIAAFAFLLLGAAVSVWYVVSKQNQSARQIVSGTRPATMRPFRVEKLTETGKNRHGVISPDGQYVSYTVEANGRIGIWLRELATGSGREIVSLSERLGGLTFAHSGKYLYFVKGPAESVAMYRVALPFGGVPVKLIEKLEATFALSPDDAQVAFIRYSDDDRECALMIADVDGGHERVVARHAQPDRFNSPAWSPDGQVVVVASGPSDSGSQQVRILEFNIADASEKEVSGQSWFHVSRIVWLPDRSGLLVVGTRKLGEYKQIWRMSYPGGEVSPLTDGLTSYVDLSITSDAVKGVAPQATFNSNVWIGPASAAQKLKRITHAAADICWMPDGRLIFSSLDSHKPNLWIMEPDGSERRQLTNEGETNATPAITPDGRYIAFVSNRGGLLQIWRMDADGSNPTALTNRAGANYPTIASDGEWVFYNFVDDWSLWKVPIRGGEPLRLTNSNTFFPAVSPDGKMVACIHKDKKNSRKLLIVSATDGQALREFELPGLKLSSHRLRWSADGSAVLYAASQDGFAGIYRQSLAGGVPKKMFELNEDDIFDFGYSPNGQQLAVTRGDWQFDIVLLSGLN